MSDIYIAVAGTGDPSPETDLLAEEVGRLVARRGAILVCGGLGGVMEAASRGAASEDGITIGILPGQDRRHANPHVRVALPTGMGEMRNTLIVRAADVVVAIGGGFGTLSEIAFALKSGTPVVGLRSWDLGAAGAAGAIHEVDSAEEAVEAALRLAQSG